MDNRKNGDHYLLKGISTERLAAFMGISVKELYLLKTEVTPVRDADGTVSAFMVEFTNEAPEAILKKITRLVDGRYVYILVNEVKMTDVNYWK
ncbi:MAG: hypothetical protein JXR54_11270 [Tannerellaceae bacterium]|nr:hypothetical protein [Tannerellaceae bacterium]